MDSRDRADLNVRETQVEGLAGGRYTIIGWDLDPRLRPLVLRHGAYAGTGGGPVIRRELPTAGVPLILVKGEPYLISNPQAPDRPFQRVQSFMVGMHDTFSSSWTPGVTEAIQIDLAPLAARHLVRGPMRDLRNRMVPLADLPTGVSAAFEERIWNESTWERRILVLERELLARLLSLKVSPQIGWIWRYLHDCSVPMAMRELARDVGWSQKHLIAKSHEQFGMSPGRLVRQLRFTRAVETLRDDRQHGTFADLAQRLGYFDQAHFAREFKRFAGVSPGEFARIDRAGGIPLER